MSRPSLMVQAGFIRLNNRLVRCRRVRVRPERLLVLAAHCLQGAACGRNLNQGIEACQGCGRCPVKGLLDLRRRYGVICRIAAGGRQALAYVKDPAVDAVVAVACEKELVEGILGSFPKPVFAVCNTRPRGACHETQADLSEVEAAVRAWLVTPGETAAGA